MIRFPNPGSNIDNFINIYTELFNALIHSEKFDLDDMTSVLIARNLATSSGFMGEEALERSYREDRSRDPLYNQSKMYSELFKLLGWIHPTQDSALNFYFNYLGAHIATAEYDPKALVRECVLGIAYPNRILDIQHDHKVRPFFTILKTMNSLGGLIYRDEMIVGPLNMQDDRDANEYGNMIEEILAIRGNREKLESKMDSVSKEFDIKKNTMKNYTRFPLGVLDWTEWVEPEYNREVYGSRLKFRKLTDMGLKKVLELDQVIDVRVSDLDDFEEEKEEAFIRLGFFQMMERSGFDIQEYQAQIEEDKKTIEGDIDVSQRILFSPFQEMAPKSIGNIFPRASGKDMFNGSEPVASGGENVAKDISTQLEILEEAHHETRAEEFMIELPDEDKEGRRPITLQIRTIVDSCRDMNKDEFYPLVAELFRRMGLDCQHTRGGVNYQRWDAFIYDDSYSIPIEIKSPGEEEFISVKAVRQALENKIILLSREPFPTTLDTTSLIVGYRYPNDRSEVYSLISDIFKVYEIVIGAIDLTTLVYLTHNAEKQKRNCPIEEIKEIHGFLEI